MTIVRLPILPLILALVIYRGKYPALDDFMQRLMGELFLWVTGTMCFTTFAFGILAMKLPIPGVGFAFILPAVFAGYGTVLNFSCWIA